LCHRISVAVSSHLLESALAGKANAIIRRLDLFLSSFRVEFGVFYDVALSAFVSVLAWQWTVAWPLVMLRQWTVAWPLLTLWQ
jgi:hypothetical protein